MNPVVKKILESFQYVPDRNYMTLNHMNKWGITQADLNQFNHYTRYFEWVSGTHLGEYVVYLKTGNKTLEAYQIQNLFKNLIENED